MESVDPCERKGLLLHPLRRDTALGSVAGAIFRCRSVADASSEYDKHKLIDIAHSLTKTPKEFPADELVTPQQVIFKATDGVEVHGQLFVPRDGKPTEKHPALVFMHGGSMRQMLLGWHYMYYYSNSYAMNQYLANHGYVVLSVNYRSGIGYGRAFREAPGRAGRGATEYRDVVAAGKFLQARPDVDASRVGLWGGSYGGFLTAMGLAHNSDIFAAGVDFHGVHDWPTDNWDGKNISPELDEAGARVFTGERGRYVEIASAVHSWR